MPLVLPSLGILTTEAFCFSKMVDLVLRRGILWSTNLSYKSMGNGLCPHHDVTLMCAYVTVLEG